MQCESDSRQNAKDFWQVTEDKLEWNQCSIEFDDFVEFLMDHNLPVKLGYKNEISGIKRLEEGVY